MLPASQVSFRSVPFLLFGSVYGIMLNFCALYKNEWRQKKENEWLESWGLQFNWESNHQECPKWHSLGSSGCPQDFSWIVLCSIMYKTAGNESPETRKTSLIKCRCTEFWDMNAMNGLSHWLPKFESWFYHLVHSVRSIFLLVKWDNNST